MRAVEAEENSLLTVEDSLSKQEKVLRSISVLNRTRESLSASGCISDSEGQLLEKALAKQLTVRRAELISSTQSFDASVIVRTSTPLPEASCKESCSRRFFSAPARSPNPNPSFFAPEDHDLPLRTLLQDLHSQSCMDYQPHGDPAFVHEVEGDFLDVTESLINSPLAPTVPWSPARQSFDLNESVSTLPIVITEPTLNSLSIAPEVIEDSSARQSFDLNKSVSALPIVITEPTLNSLSIPLEVIGESSRKMDDAEKVCNANVRQFKMRLRLTDPNDIEPSHTEKRHIDMWQEELKENVEDVVGSIGQLCTEFGQILGSDTVKVWKDTITTCEDEFKERRKALMAVAVLNPPASVSVLPPPASVSVPLVPQPTPAHTGGIKSYKAQEALADITVDYEIIVEEGDKLKEEYDHSWDSASDNDIELAMNKIVDWRRKFERLQDKRWNIHRKTISYHLDDQKKHSVTHYMNILGSELDMAMDRIKFEDQTRCLFSTIKSKNASVKLPTFGGEAEDDFSKFEKEMKKGLVTNRVKRADQVAQLREHLKARPKGMIPSNMEDIDEAWRILREIYGDATRVIKAKRAKIQAMRQLPSRSNTSAEKVEEHIEWLLKLELALQDMFEIGKQSADMDRMAFGPDLVDTIHRLFPFDIQEKFADFDAIDSKAKLSLMFEYIAELRRKKQILLRSASEGAVEKGAGGHGRGYGQGGGGAKKDTSQRFVPTSAVQYNPAQRDVKCRICVTLDAEGETDGLYDDHHHSVASGCPKFADMRRETKWNYVIKAQICPDCLNADFVKKPGKSHVDCPVRSKDAFYTCKGDGCKRHYWLCNIHENLNKRNLDKSKIYWLDKGKTFACFASALKTAPGKFSKKNLGTAFDSKAIEEKEENPDKVSDDSSFDSKKSSKQKVLQKKRSNTRNVKANNSSNESVKGCCLGDATEKLKEAAKGAKVVEVPEGDPLFLFSLAVGKTRPITVFYDKGCSNVVFKEGVPVNELEAVMTRKGPLTINGVGDSKVKVLDEWACLIDKDDGSKQVVQGVAVKNITTEFPLIDVSEAVKEVKADDPGNKELQNLKIPDLVGGEPDVLLGIMYESCHPIKIHTLPSGLFLARVKLASYGGWTGVIGGPHKSFRLLAEQAGNASNLMAHFVDGLQQFGKLGPPKLYTPMVTWDDVQFAQQMNKAEVQQIVGEDFIEEVVEVDESFDNNYEDFDVQGAVEVKEPLQCMMCGLDVAEDLSEVMEEISEVVSKVPNDEVFAELASMMSASVDNDDKLRELKMVVKMQELGISLEYRCPNCRSCNSCRNAPDTERISIREEAEDQAIRDAVTIDFEKKKIVCSLPLRGKEEEFLSNNREIALKVLNSQCKKVKGNEEAKASVLKSFKKLFDGNYARKFSDLTKEQQKMILSKPVQNYLPWRVVYKESISTPCRTVMDASSKTPLLPNGQGGRCLNDLCVKGKVSSLDLLNMLLRFVTGSVACAGDLKQFYPSIGLKEDQWNLQRLLFKDGLDVDADVIELIIVSLIYGVRPVSALSERAVIMLAEYIQPSNPRLAALLIKSRFVDDLADSGKNSKVINKLIEDADELLNSVDLHCKGWSRSGMPPHPDVTNDGVSVDVGGMTWYPEIDAIAVKIPPLHFGRKSRGKLMVGTEVFDGSFADLEKFCSKRMTRRQVVSKFSAVFDLFGHLTPVTAGMKLDVSEAVKETEGWDQEVSFDLHSKVVKNMWRLYKLKGMKFSRAKVPIDAADSKLHLLCCVDAADKLKVVGVWARFRRKDGSFSSQLLIGRSLLSKGGTIPKEELEALMMGSNLLWICRRALEDWLEDYSLLGDSVIALCWVTSEKKRLSIFHRNRCNQVRMNTSMEKLFHIRTEYNPADLGTRPSKVQDHDIGPDSVWETGLDWMRSDLTEVLETGIMTPAANLRLKDEEEESEFEKGLIFEKCPEILVRGHSAFVNDRTEKLMTRATFSNYVMMPTKFSFRKIIRITAWMFKMFGKRKHEEIDDGHKFRMFIAVKSDDQDNLIKEEYSLSKFFDSDDKWRNVCLGTTPVQVLGEAFDDINEEDISRSLTYWFQKGTSEVKQFNKKEVIAKLAVEKKGILFSRSRILDGQRFLMAGGFKADSLGLEVQLNLMTPMLDRHSPISLSIALYIHQDLGLHAGYETCFRLSLGFCHIIQGASLFRIIGEECVKCSMLRKKYLEVIMGPISDHQLTLCPAFFIAFCDLDGPYGVLVPGFEKQTRGRKVITSKVWIMTFVCPMTKLINLQVIESKSAEGVLEGLTRLGCENGLPSYLLLDQESSFMKAVKEAELDLRDIDQKTFKEKGVRCEIAPVSGHNFTGLVERKIRTVQDCFEKMDLSKKRLHATGLQTLAKLVETQLNNLPLGFSYGRDADNTPLLKLVTPNLMKIGRINSRAVDGPLRFPTGPKDLMVKVEQVFDAFYKIWNISMVPKLIPQPKWFKEHPELKPEDVVYYQKSESDLASKWTVGQVDSVVRSKDGVIRRVTVRYYNYGEKTPRFTDRAVRSLVRLFNIEDNYWVNDMAKCEELVKEFQKKQPKEKVDPIKIVRAADGQFKVRGGEASVKKSCGCCCVSHCALSREYHNSAGRVVGTDLAKLDDTPDVGGLTFPNIYERDLVEDLCIDEPLLSEVEMKDEIIAMMTAMGTDFGLS